MVFESVPQPNNPPVQVRNEPELQVLRLAPYNWETEA